VSIVQMDCSFTRNKVYVLTGLIIIIVSMIFLKIGFASVFFFFLLLLLYLSPHRLLCVCLSIILRIKANVHTIDWTPLKNEEQKKIRRERKENCVSVNEVSEEPYL